MASSRLLNNVSQLKLLDMKWMLSANPDGYYRILVSLLSRNTTSIALTMLSTGRGVSIVYRPVDAENLIDMEGIMGVAAGYLAFTSTTSS